MVDAPTEIFHSVNRLWQGYPQATAGGPAPTADRGWPRHDLPREPKMEPLVEKGKIVKLSVLAANPFYSVSLLSGPDPFAGFQHTEVRRRLRGQ